MEPLLVKAFEKEIRDLADVLDIMVKEFILAQTRVEEVSASDGASPGRKDGWNNRMMKGVWLGIKIFCPDVVLSTMIRAKFGKIAVHEGSELLGREKEIRVITDKKDMLAYSVIPEMQRTGDYREKIIDNEHFCIAVIGKDRFVTENVLNGVLSAANRVKTASRRS